MRIKRKKPTTRAGRKRATELRRILRNRRTRFTDRVAALYELDQLAPALPPGPTWSERAMAYFYSRPVAGQSRLQEVFAADASEFALWFTDQYRRMVEGKASVLTGEQSNAN